MDNIIIKTKYTSENEVTLNTTSEEYRVDIVSTGEINSARIYNRNYLNQALAKLGIFKPPTETINFEYCKIYVNNTLLIEIEAENVSKITYRLEIGNNQDFSCREYIEYILISL